MKRFTVPCLFADVKHPFHVYVGEPTPHLHPLKYQEAWLREVRGGIMPDDVLSSFLRLCDIARENNVSFEDLCVYAMGTAAEEEKASAAAEAPLDTPEE